MSRWSALRELIAPGTVRRAAIPPLEAGLRPNQDLDQAKVAAEFAPLGVDDVVVADGKRYVTADSRLVELAPDSSARTVATFDGTAGSLATTAAGLVVAVHGVGLVAVGPDGATSVISDDDLLKSNVSAIAAHDDGSLFVCVASTTTPEWARALMERSRTGLLLRVGDDGGVDVLDDGLAWPSGIAVDGDDLVVSLGQRHTIQRRSISTPRAAVAVLDNLPGYPGRVRRAHDGRWWAAMPYLRNRATELLMTHRDMVEEMISTTEVDTWLVPRLRTENAYRAPLQVGQIRVLGQIKPWAPPRTYGLAFQFTADGHVVRSAHSRADGTQHGVTGIAVTDEGTVVVVCRGAGTVLELVAEQP